MRSDYGPEVICDFTDSVESTHRPAGSSDPWFCMACGSTEHPVVRPHSEDVVLIGAAS